MSLLKKHILLFILGISIICPNRSKAGLYGFSKAVPYSYEEELLNIDVPPERISNYREMLRKNLMMLISYAKQQKPSFQIMAHEGKELLEKSLWEYHLDGYNSARKQGVNVNDPSFLMDLHHRRETTEPPVGSLARKYLNNLDAIALNNIYCGNQNIPSLLKKHNIKVISIDQCADTESFDKALINSAMDKNLFYGIEEPSFAFNNIEHQPVINETAKNVSSIRDASNILFLTDDQKFADKFSMIQALRNTNYDVVVIRPLFHNQHSFTPEEIRSLQYKKNGTRRLLIAEMNLTEANASEYYWHPDWKIGSPDWLVRASFVNDNAVITAYWSHDWQKIISAYFQSIVNSEYDGVFFTGLENHEYFEKQTPLE